MSKFQIGDEIIYTKNSDNGKIVDIRQVHTELQYLIEYISNYGYIQKTWKTENQIKLNVSKYRELKLNELGIT